MKPLKSGFEERYEEGSEESQRYEELVERETIRRPKDNLHE